MFISNPSENFYKQKCKQYLEMVMVRIQIIFTCIMTAKEKRIHTIEFLGKKLTGRAGQ